MAREIYIMSAECIYQGCIYSQYKTRKGDIVTLEHWIDYFEDKDRGIAVPIQRSEPVSFNGKPLAWIPQSQWNSMSREERAAREIDL